MTGRRIDDGQVGGDHYKAMEITPWQFLESCLTPEELRGYFKGEAIVYIARELGKGGALDISKARHVLQKLEQLDAAKSAATVPSQSTATEALRQVGDRIAREMKSIEELAAELNALAHLQKP